MKTQFLLIAIMAISLKANPFLRKLADTEESCKEAGKDYQITKPAQCKAGDKIYNVTKEEECKSGKWSGAEEASCSAKSIKEKDKCDGTPTYTAAVEAKAATCKTENVEIKNEEMLSSKEKCEVTLSWDGTESKCSVSEITDSTKCSGTLSYSPAVKASSAKCTVNNIEITDAEFLADSSTCQTKLVWTNKGTCTGSTAVTIKAICDAQKPEFTAETGKCVDKANSNSFLSFKFALILVVYLLF